MADSFDDLRTRIEQGEWTAAVIGLGYVGLPLAVATVIKEIRTLGLDVSQDRVDALNAGTSHIDDISDAELEEAINGGFVATTDEMELSGADVVFICVPSPLGRNRQPDLSYIQAASDAVARFARPGQLICLESTTYPGTTEDFLLPAVATAGLEIDKDVWLAFSPERVSPGDDLKTAEIPKVVGGVTADSGELATLAYSQIVPAVHPVSSSAVAEMSKLLENTYRAVNIGLINELAQLAHELDIDIWEVVEAAATKPFGFQAFWPGPGVGGHCIPLDPQYLAWRAKEANFATRFIDTAEQINSRMPLYTASRVADLLNDNELPVFGTKVVAIGVAYKPNIADDRESAAYDVVNELIRRGADVSVFDPVVGADRITSRGLKAVDTVTGNAIAVILTDHSVFDYAQLARDVPIVFDARGVYRRLGIKATNVVQL